MPRTSQRTVFFVSDRTGITAEMLGNSLLSQFEDLSFPRQTIPFVDSPEKIDEILRRIDENAAARGPPPAGVQLDRRRGDERAARREANALMLDLFQVFIAAAGVGARRQVVARGRPLARHRQQPRVFRAHGSDQFHAGARRRRDDARSRQGAGDPDRRLALRQDAYRALSRAAVRHTRRELSADARRFRRQQAARLDRCRIATSCSA